jgi:hypothetical protein
MSEVTLNSDAQQGVKQEDSLNIGQAMPEFQGRSFFVS